MFPGRQKGERIAAKVADDPGRLAAESFPYDCAMIAFEKSIRPVLPTAFSIVLSMSTADCAARIAAYISATFGCAMAASRIVVISSNGMEEIGLPRSTSVLS